MFVCFSHRFGVGVAGIVLRIALQVFNVLKHDFALAVFGHHSAICVWFKWMFS